MYTKTHFLLTRSDYSQRNNNGFFGQGRKVFRFSQNTNTFSYNEKRNLFCTLVTYLKKQVEVISFFLRFSTD